VENVFSRTSAVRLALIVAADSPFVDNVP